MIKNKFLPYLIISAMTTIIILCISSVLYNVINIFTKNYIDRDIELCIGFILIFAVNIIFLENIIKTYLYTLTPYNNRLFMMINKIILAFSKIHKMIIFILSFIILLLEVIYRINIIEIEIGIINNIITSGIITEILIMSIYAIILRVLIPELK